MVSASEPASVVRWTTIVLGTVVLCFGAYVMCVPRNGHRSDVLEDVNNVRQMVAEMLMADRIEATADGRIDVYRVVFGQIELTEENVAILRHVRSDRGPSIAEVRAGDYGNFVWERALAEDVRGAAEKVPMLWDPRPIDGKRVVGFSDGRVKVLTEEEFQGLRR
jgi:hypothetical protein